MNNLAKWFPLIVILIAAAYLVSLVPQPSDAKGQMKLQEFGRLPVVYQGRVKPLDTLARNSLLVISNRQYFTDDAGKRHPAIEWLADVMSGSPRATQYKVFRIDNTQVLELLGLTPREGFRYAIDEFQAKLGEVDKAANKAHSVKSGDRDVFENQIVQFADRMQVFMALQESTSMPPMQSREAVMAVVQRFKQLESSGLALPHLVPPTAKGEQWQPLLGAVLKSVVDPDTSPALRPLATMMVARGTDDVKMFNEALVEYQKILAQNPPPKTDVDLLAFETVFNHLEPFYNIAVLYVLVLVLAVFAWLGWNVPLNRAAFWLMLLAFALHTLALIARIYISGRPPVTNLYSSAVFIGWGAVLFGLALEYFYRLGLGNLLGAVVGFVTLLIAHHLAMERDTFEVMQAVLDTNFWLATHVVCVTFGYASTFVAGFLGIAYILIGIFTPALSTEVGRAESAAAVPKGKSLPMGALLYRMIYGTICFAMFFSFVGTVLGGLWADDSWGRFWGWDTKENGALIIVLWNALMLHARWGGMVKQRGLAVLAVFGNVVTSWSWFGVNMLGVGFHSYGFMNSAPFWLGGFILTQLAIIALGLFPLDLWRSFAPVTPELMPSPKGAAAPGV